MENNYLCVDDLMQECEEFPREILEKMTKVNRGKEYRGTFGTFNWNDYQKIMEIVKI